MNWLGWNKHRRGLDGGQNSLNNINAQHHRTRHFNALTDIRNKTWTGILWIITGPFPQLRNNSHYVGTAVWPWGWLLVVFLQLRSKFASTNNMTAKGMAKKKKHYRTFFEAIRIQPDHPWINTSPYIIATSGDGSIQVEAEWTTTVAPTA